MCLFGGACAGTLYEMITSNWYKDHLKAKNAKMVIAFYSPPAKNIHNLDWLPRAHDDNFSPSWFKGLAWPEKKLLDAGFGVVIGGSSKEIADKFPGFKSKFDEEEPVEETFEEDFEAPMEETEEEPVQNTVNVHINTDNIFNKKTDNEVMHKIGSQLASRGYSFTYGGIGPNYHYSEVKTSIPQNGIYMTLFGGACAGTLYEMITSNWYKDHLKAKNARMVIAFYSPPAKNIHNLDWLPRAHDDNFSPKWFKGLAWPEKKLLDAGFGVVIGASPAEMVSKFPGFKDSPNVDIEKAVDEVGHLAERITYSGECQTHDCVASELTGDCWGMSDYISCELKTRGVESKILQYGTEYASNHRSVKYQDADGNWRRFPYRSYNIDMLFRDTDGVENGFEVDKTC